MSTPASDATWRRSSSRTAALLEGGEGLLRDEDGEPLALVVNPRPHDFAHFAVWPPQLVAPMILSGTSAHGCCAKCGAPWTRAGASCTCGTSDVVPSVVLDPFGGSGTTALVARQLGRRAIHLDAAYLDIARARLAGVSPLRAGRA